MKLFIYKDLQEMSLKAAEAFIAYAKAAIDENGRFVVVLAGGETPRTLYKMLSSVKFSSEIDWSKVIFFFGDERNVPPDDIESNYRMCRETLFVPLAIPEKNIYRIRGEADPHAAAEEYEAVLKKFFPGDCIFDLTLLGLGSDCHTLSIFPGSQAVTEDKRLVVENYSERLKSRRVTLTFKAVNASKQVFFLVSGESKAKALRDTLKGDLSITECPAKGIKPERGELIVYADTMAAGSIA